MEEMPPQNRTNQESEQPIVPNNKAHSERLIVLLIVLAVITIAGAGYFLDGKKLNRQFLKRKIPRLPLPMKLEIQMFLVAGKIISIITTTEKLLMLLLQHFKSLGMDGQKIKIVPIIFLM